MLTGAFEPAIPIGDHEPIGIAKRSVRCRHSAVAGVAENGDAGPRQIVAERASRE